MLDQFIVHNQFWNSISGFLKHDPQLTLLAKQKYQFYEQWWNQLSFDCPGIYILTGGRQVGKSTSCKLLLADCLKQKRFNEQSLFYLPCDEIYDPKEFSRVIRLFLDQTHQAPFLLIIDEVTFVPHWDRVIKSLADEGWFQSGLCLLTGSDSVILKESAMSFPGRRGGSVQSDFHLYPLSFRQYVDLMSKHKKEIGEQDLKKWFGQFLITGGYLRAINDFAYRGEVHSSTFDTYEQWIRGDFLKRGKNEESLLSIFSGLVKNGVSQISYSSLTHNIGNLSKETVMDYCRLLERMDILFDLQAFDQNKKQGFPRKARKLHFFDPFILRTIHRWLEREGYISHGLLEQNLVEATVASHCYRLYKTFYFKGQGEVDVVYLSEQKSIAVEVKWSNQVRLNDLKTLKQFKNNMVLSKGSQEFLVDGVTSKSVWQYLYEL